MTQNTKIEWADHTFNPWWGCTKISPACDHCYAAALDKRTGGDHWGANQPRKRTSANNWFEPVKWNKQAAAFFAEHGRRQRVFCASMADVFDNAVDPQWRLALFELIACTPNLDWMILTKRIGNVLSMCSGDSVMFEMISARVWLGATICNQEEADRDIPKLLAVPAAKRFLSIEPMLGAIDLTHLNKDNETNEINCLQPYKWEAEIENWRATTETWEDDFEDYFDKSVSDVAGDMHSKLDWVIVGGESGPGARPMHPEWARSLRDQCAAADVPFLFKQWGEWASGYTTTTDDGVVFRQFTSHQQWVNKASSWVAGGICLDKTGMQLRNGGDMARTRDEDKFPVTIMHKIGKKKAGRLLDGVEHNGIPI